MDCVLVIGSPVRLLKFLITMKKGNIEKMSTKKIKIKEEMTKEEMIEKIKALDESRINMFKHFSERIRVLKEEVEMSKIGVAQVNDTVNAIIIEMAKKYGTLEEDGSLLLNIGRPKLDAVGMYELISEIDTNKDYMEIKVKKNEIQK